MDNNNQVSIQARNFINGILDYDADYYRNLKFELDYFYRAHISSNTPGANDPEFRDESFSSYLKIQSLLQDIIELQIFLTERKITSFEKMMNNIQHVIEEVE